MKNQAAYKVTMLDGFGYTSGQRRFDSSNKYDKYWNPAHVNGTEKQLIEVGQTLGAKTTTLATQDQMNVIVLNTLYQTEEIAQALRGKNLHETLRNIAHYFQYHYRYKQDHASREQLRTPARAHADRRTGVDCDCFSISVSSILTNLGIEHYWRKTKPYKSDPDYGHIYVVVPKFKGADLNVRANYYVIDPVVTEKAFDWEHTNNQVPPYKHDYKVSTTMQGMGAILAFQPLASQQMTVDKIFKYAGIAALAIGGFLLITSKSETK